MEKIEIKYIVWWSVLKILGSIIIGWFFVDSIIADRYSPRFLMYIAPLWPAYLIYINMSRLLRQTSAITITDTSITMNEDGLVTEFTWPEIKNIFLGEKGSRLTATHRTQDTYSETTDRDEMKGIRGVYLCVEPIKMTRSGVAAVNIKPLNENEVEVVELILSKAPKQYSEQWQISSVFKNRVT